jgi:hypothetical protein
MRRLRPRLTIWRCMALVAIVAYCLAVIASRRIVEELDSAVAITGWSNQGLILADGQTVKLPEIQVLPLSSAALSEATKRGVELGRDGRVIGLVRVHHWCGNDPMREHIARVDLSYLLAFVGQGQLAVPLDPELQIRTAQAPGGRFSPYGWEVGEFLQFRSWCWLAADSERSQAAAQRKASPSERSSTPQNP